ncbi:hypothetical protein BC938DRAFT_478484 [Jimgerdemannia flammicorona]|uniref:Uncharacterized protein n=1 Tax=Jimgerdemannia flammicorona TaxID=994334 RepID=A0A433QMS8_9FUNG|nr:hypothetical protein BC938DRAFT_478484 [Jimgerdemannia flammicorona]
MLYSADCLGMLWRLVSDGERPSRTNVIGYWINQSVTVGGLREQYHRLWEIVSDGFQHVRYSLAPLRSRDSSNRDSCFAFIVFGDTDQEREPLESSLAGLYCCMGGVENMMGMVGWRLGLSENTRCLAHHCS